MAANDILSGFAERKVHTVSDVNAMVRTALEGAFDELWIEGEVSNYVFAASGHRYFSLKDEQSQIRAVMFRGSAQYLRFEPENGMQVILRATLTVYEPRGEYQLNVQMLEPSGVGALQIAFEQLKKKLEEEGLFDPARKKELPVLPRRLGIITSPSGAAIRDILTILRRRYPDIQVTVYPSLVQGEGAPAQIAEGVRTLDEMGRFDVLIVTRGGGSMEDLWAFNDEGVARAIADCKIPVISAVGHEIDFTIADFVADVRAPTPSAAAEIVVGRKDLLLQSISQLRRRLANALTAKVRQVKALLQASTPARFLAAINNLFQAGSQRADDLSHRLAMGTASFAAGKRQQLSRAVAALEALNPLSALKRGYCIATLSGRKEPLHSVAGLSRDDDLDLRLSDGKVGCSVTVVEEENTVE